MPRKGFVIQRCSLKMLAFHYACSRQTMYRYIKKIDIGPRVSRDFSSGQVRKIVQHLGYP